MAEIKVAMIPGKNQGIVGKIDIETGEKVDKTSASLNIEKVMQRKNDVVDTLSSGMA